MKTTRWALPLIAALAVACGDGPTAPEPTPRGTLDVPAGTYGVLFEIDSEASVAGVSAGWGDLLVHTSEAGSRPFRVLLLSEIEMADRIPVRIEWSGDPGTATGRLLETSTEDGAVETHAAEFILR